MKETITSNTLKKKHYSTQIQDHMYYLATFLKHTWPNMTYISRHTS